MSEMASRTVPSSRSTGPPSGPRSRVSPSSSSRRTGRSKCLKGATSIRHLRQDNARYTGVLAEAGVAPPEERLQQQDLPMNEPHPTALQLLERHLEIGIMR